MAEDLELLHFAQRINAEIHDRASGAESNGTADFKENVFSDYILEHLADIGIVENFEVCHFEKKIPKGSIKVNGFAVNDDGDMLDLYTTYFLDREMPEKVSKEDITRCAKDAIRFLDAARKGLHNQIEPASDVFAMASRIHETMPNITRARIFVLTDGLSRVKDVRGAKVRGLPVTLEVEIWDIERLFRSMQSGLPRDLIEIDLQEKFGNPIPCVSIPTSDDEYIAYLMIMPAEVLFQLYDEYGPRLLEYNVRSFLQAKGKVNKGIRDTLKNEPNRFMAIKGGRKARR
jgi:hypothetical protein